MYGGVFSCKFRFEWCNALFAGTLRTDTLGHVVSGLNMESVRKFYHRNRNLLKAECAVADFTVEMYVAVIVNITFGVTQFIADPLAAVINLMQKVVLLEQRKGAEYAGLVYGVNLILQLGHSNRVMTVCQSL